MSSRRSARLGSQIKDEISVVINQEVRDPRIGFVTVTGAQLSPDLKHAKVFISVFGSDDDKTNSLRALNHAAGYIRHLLGERLNLKFTPELSFLIDEAPEYGAKIEQLIEEIKSKQDKAD